MCIPFGAASVLGGIAFFFLNLTNIAATAVIAGATSLVASFLSLQEWKQSGDSTVYTLTSAASAAFVTYTAVQALPAIKGALPYGLAVALASLAAAAAAFCLYNVAAGGNPPPKGEKKK
ncbi:hypothetical protein HYH03_009200 [Edaphochlamys debaryana]|uniref:Uncharacterized protein n=1 Tax=Edaphochlamys debaryana TaxID=47281 RepID=A0A836BXH1_9CHLO|nr:hypothetical protein HYH03_009200 [Edaphochlamys debaryana]|eukprot:KAG2492535.1 hypothetical protein HYH03_009200 [Edaphochlamys debaryana]